MRLRTNPALAMGAGTALSRVTGLARTVALATALGVTATADAYNTANTVPVMIFTLVAGGMISAAFVPFLVTEEDDHRQAHVASVLVTLIALGTLAGSLVLFAGAPWVMRGLTFGARHRDDYEAFLSLGVRWLRIFASQVLWYGLGAAAVAVMNARGRLALAGFAPVLTNLVTVTAAVIVVVVAETSVRSAGAVEGWVVATLGWGTTAGVAAMALVQIWGARRALPGLSLRVAPRDPVVRQFLKVGSWMVLYVTINQIGLALVVALANSVVGGVTAYQWAFMLMQLPYAVIAVSIYSAASPQLARAAKDSAALGRLLADTTRGSVALLLPSAVGLAALAVPLAVLVVGRRDAPLLAAAVQGFAWSLVPFSVFQLLTRTSYARKDTRTPALVNVAVNGVNMAVNVAVVLVAAGAPATVRGLAAGHAASYAVGCVVMAVVLKRAGVPVRGLIEGHGPAVAGAATTALALFVLAGATRTPSSRPAAAGAVGVAVALGGTLFALVRHLWTRRASQWTDVGGEAQQVVELDAGADHGRGADANDPHDEGVE